MTLAQYVALGAGGGLAFSAAIIGAAVVIYRKFDRARQKSLDEFHALRATVSESLRAKGNHGRFSLKPERTKNDG